MCDEQSGSSECFDSSEAIPASVRCEIEEEETRIRTRRVCLRGVVITPFLSPGLCGTK